ncbi:MAG: hypothetical protein ACJAT2_001912 [Bacteriovoracaceae bacterium]|jgi:hypothetical protein
MSEQLWVALLIAACWASLPISLIYANNVFDNDVVKEGEEAGHH